MKAVIFDFNGTMIFDDRLHESAWRQFFSLKTGRNITDDEFHTYVHGRTSEDILKYFIDRELTASEINRLEEEKELIYRQLCLESDSFRLVDGLANFLDLLKEKNIPVTIATSSAYSNTRFFFDNLPLSAWFDFDRTVYSDGTLRGKPFPDLYLKAAEKLGVDIKDCTVFEDSASGIESAFRAGAGKIICVGCKISADTLKKYNVYTAIKDYTDIHI